MFYIILFMKKFLLYLTILFSILCFTTKQTSAQVETEKALFVEIIIPDEEIGKVTHKFEIPNNFNFETSLIGGGFATVDCIKCVLTSSYQFWIFKAERVNEEKSKLGFKASFDNKSNCNTAKEVTIERSKKRTFNLKCGVKVVAHYAPKSETK